MRRFFTPGTSLPPSCLSSLRVQLCHHHVWNTSFATCCRYDLTCDLPSAQIHPLVRKSLSPCVNNMLLFNLLLLLVTFLNRGGYWCCQLIHCNYFHRTPLSSIYWMFFAACGFSSLILSISNSTYRAIAITDWKRFFQTSATQFSFCHPSVTVLHCFLVDTYWMLPIDNGLWKDKEQKKGKELNVMFVYLLFEMVTVKWIWLDDNG